MKTKMIELNLIGGRLKMGILLSLALLMLITYATTLSAAPMKFKGDSTIEGQFTVSDGTKSLVFIKSDGNMGIGTTDPKTKLHIFKADSGHSLQSNASLIVENNDHTWINLSVPNGKETGILWTSDTSTAHSGITHDTTNGLSFRTGENSTKLIIKHNGDVGIGTTDPGFKLEVGSDDTWQTTIGIKNTSNRVCFALRTH